MALHSNRLSDPARTLLPSQKVTSMQWTNDCEQTLLDRLSAAGAEGANTTALKLPAASTQKGKACRQALRKLLKAGQIGNLGSPSRPRYVIAEHYKPLEIAYELIAQQVKDAGLRLQSKTALAKRLRGAPAKQLDAALKLLVAEGILLRLNWAGRPVYLHRASVSVPANPQPSDPAVMQTIPAQQAEILEAYQQAVREFGYPDVLIHEVFTRWHGDLETFKQILIDACRQGTAIPSAGDWSLATAEERDAAIMLDGRPQLRIRFKA